MKVREKIRNDTEDVVSHHQNKEEFKGKRLEKVLIDFLIGAKISGATVWTGVDGFGKRRRSTIYLEGIAINMPMMIEVIDDKSKLEPLLPQIRRMVGDNGLVTLHEVNVIQNEIYFASAVLQLALSACEEKIK